MDFNLSNEQQMLRDSVRRFVRENYGFEQFRALLASELGFSEAHWQTYAELGWLALGLSEDAGGLGCSLTDTAILVEALGQGLVLEPYIVNMVLCARLVEHVPDTALRQTLLEAMGSGALRLALAHDEPGQTHSRSAWSTKARALPEGGFRLDGSKTVVFGAPSAGRYLVSATLASSDAAALFLLDKDTPGLNVKAYRLIDGSAAADLVLSDCRVSAEALLLAGAAAVEALEEALDRAVLATVAESLGAMESVLRISAEYLRTRAQFGQPLGKFQALQHRMSEMFVEVQATRSVLMHGLACSAAEPAVRATAVSAARLTAGQASRFVGGQGIQLHGGMGMTEECSVGHFFKRLTVLERSFGDADWHAKRLARLRCA